jgi:hypothetical protein
MELFLVYLAGLALFIYGIVWLRTRASHDADESVADRRPDTDGAANVYAEHQGTLEERWRMAGITAHSKRELILPTWYYDDAESWQAERIRGERIPIDIEALTRGQASDVIGLLHPPGEDDAETLRRLNEPVAGMNRTAARQHAAKLLGIDVHRQRWNAQPPTPLHRAYFVLRGEPCPADTAGDAERAIAAAQELDPGQVREWGFFLQLYDDLQLREHEFGIGPVGAELLARALRDLRTERQRTLAQLARDLDMVIDRLLELEPALQRE